MTETVCSGVASPPRARAGRSVLGALAGLLAPGEGGACAAGLRAP